MSDEIGEDIVITGYQGAPYRYDGAHEDGRALDLRVYNLSRPWRVAKTLEGLGYEVLYGDPNHRDHIHVGIDRDSTY